MRYYQGKSLLHLKSAKVSFKKISLGQTSNEFSARTRTHEQGVRCWKYHSKTEAAQLFYENEFGH